MSLREKQSLFLFNVHKLIEWAYRNGFELTGGELWRTRAQVLLNFYGYDVVENDGVLSLIKTIATSQTLKSRHPQRLAIDLNVFRNGLWIRSAVDIKPLGDYWVSLHTDNVWGSDWNRDGSILDETFIDASHFEMRP